MISGECQLGCDLLNTIQYKYRFYKKWNLSIDEPQDKWIPFDISRKSDFILGNLNFIQNILKEIS